MKISPRRPVAIACLVMIACQAMLLSGAPQAIAGGGPENVMLVVNERSLSSKLVANHYISLRNIPEKNVVYLRDIPKSDLIKLDDCREKILEPILTEIQNRKLVGSIDYIVYSSGFPTRVSVAEHQEMLKNAVGKNFTSKFFAPVASLTSVTYFASSIISNDPTYMDLKANHYYRLSYNQALSTPFSGAMLKRYQDATAAIRSTGQPFTDGQNELVAMARKHPGQAAVQYQAARFFAVEGDKDNAISYLTMAIAMGWKHKSFIQRDANFAKIKDDPLFKGITDRVPESTSNAIETHGFRNAYYWAPNGMINGERLGARYFLSAMLSVTSKLGMSDYDSVNYLTRAVNADHTQPKGTFYFTSTSDVRTTTRKSNFQKSITILQGLGQQTRIVKQRLPERRDDVLGLSCGTAKFDWAASGSQFMAGAIADNLTSTGAHFGSAGQTKCTKFLQGGAAGACGTVVEPYAIQAKFPHPMIHAHYARGCSLAEAYYQSVWGPYQLLLVADPLCQPFAKKIEVAVTAPKPMEILKDKFDVLVEVSESEDDIAGFEVFVDDVMILRQRDLGTLSIETANMADGYHELRIVAVGRDAIETRGYGQVPFFTDNSGHSIELSSDAQKYSFDQKIELKASANTGDRIVIKQNQKTVGVINSINGTASISPSVLGIGTIKLRAYAIGGQDTAAVSSEPIVIEIEGDISQTPEM